MKYKHGEGTKKVPLPVAVHLNQAVGALTLHTGVGAVLYTTEPAAISCVAKQTISMRRAQKMDRKDSRYSYII